MIIPIEYELPSLAQQLDDLAALVAAGHLTLAEALAIEQQLHNTCASRRLGRLAHITWESTDIVWEK